MNRDELIEHQREEIKALKAANLELGDRLFNRAAEGLDMLGELAQLEFEREILTKTLNRVAIHIRPTCTALYNEIMEVLREESK